MSDDAEQNDMTPLPLDAWHRAQGARLVSFAGYAMPIQYEGIMAEHQWTRENAGLFDVSHMGQLGFGGEGVAKALERILPGNIQELAPGKMRYSLLLDESGGIHDDLMVTRLPENGPFDDAAIYMVVNGATKYDDIGYLREHLPDEIAMNHMDDQALLALQGPKAVNVLKRIVPGVENLYFMEAGAFEWNGVTLWISRSGYTGEDGFEISVPADNVEQLAQALVDQDEVKPIGLGARDSLRLEAGLPLYGHDVTLETDPVTADLTFAMQKRRREEGGFMGADIVLKTLAEGPARKRVGLSITGRLPAREGAEIFVGDEKVGVVTSGGFAPSVGAPIAMGYVTAALSAPGTPLQIEVRGKRIDAVVASTPFVPHRYHRKGAAK